ncbi:nuclear transport factor 2 family protein [Tepidiforma sp.]|uniref:nuclear transport factor 2 family protein n=1 Tax=Tepidiforma sp. TaxID=2682230 RepID=UPI002ADD8698|nr:nuclear transport factor 2 family protein [Tepidiforma sp.]
MPLSVEDQLAIQQLYARYNHAIDSGNGADWAACFTPDGTFSSATGNFAGRDQLRAFGDAFAQRLKARHWTNNLVLDGDGDEATGSCYLMLLRLAPGEQPPASILTTAIYRDRLVRTAEGWKFAARTVVGDA